MFPSEDDFVIGGRGSEYIPPDPTPEQRKEWSEKYPVNTGKVYKSTYEEFFPKKEKYFPIEDEEGLFYRMFINKEEYRWEVVNREDGSEYKFACNAKSYSLKDCIKKFKEEFYGE